MARSIRLSKSVIGDEEKKAVIEVLNKEYLGMGQEVQEFENALSDFFGRSAVCVNTGTSALHLALQAIGIGPGDEVLVQSITYVASFQAISATGAKPVSCDIDPETVTLDPDDARKRITSRTKAIMPVHYASGVGRLDEVYDLANEHGLRVIEDAAHAFGCYYKGKKVGNFGDISCFSFDGIKNITSGEGGAVVTEDELVLKEVRDARLLGVEKDTEKRYSGERSWDFDVTMQGWRYHMSNIMAAIGLEQLKKFNDFSSKRKELARRYQKNLCSSGMVELLKHDLDSMVPHIYVVKLVQGDRDKVREKMLEYGVQTGVHYKPNHRLTMYAQKDVFLPVSDKISPILLTLPMHVDMTVEDVDYVSDRLLSSIESVSNQNNTI